MEEEGRGGEGEADEEEEETVEEETDEVVALGEVGYVTGTQGDVSEQ